VGVDLATEPAKTAMAVLRWPVTGAAVQSLVLNVDDAAISYAATDADKLGIDCPLGWPDDFLPDSERHEGAQVLSVEATPCSQGGSTCISVPRQRQVSDFSRR
jgi:hypothetical protein